MPNPSRETKFSGANGDEEIFIFTVQLTTSRIGNLTRLILILLLHVMTIYTYIAYVHSKATTYTPLHARSPHPG